MAIKPASPWTRRIARAAIVAAVLVLLAGPLIKYGLLGWQAGLAMFALGAAFAGIGGIISLIAVLRRRGGLLTVVAAAAGLGFYHWWYTAGEKTLPVLGTSMASR